MIRGVVQTLQARLELPVRGPGRRYRPVTVLVDTGFDGWLSLPAEMVADLDLPVVGDGQGFLADGSESRFDVHEATIRWHGRPRPIPVYAIGPAPLIGMALLDGTEVNLRVREGGAVTIKPLPRRA